MVVAGEAGYEELLGRCGFQRPAVPESQRSIVVVEVERVADSCGYGVPLMSHEGARPHQDAWAAKRLRVGGPNALLEYQREHNARSIDGLPALTDLAATGP